MNNLYYYEKILNQKKGQKQLLDKQYAKLDKQVLKAKKDLRYAEKSHIIIQTVAKETQKELSYHVSDLVSGCLSSVFENPYSLNVAFELKRGKTECQLMFKRNGIISNPLLSSGGGTVDIAAFGLRIALYILKTQVSKIRPIIILDEPFKHLSAGLHNKASNMISELSKNLNIQFIIVTHSNEFLKSADKVFPVKIKKGISYIDDV